MCSQPTADTDSGTGTPRQEEVLDHALALVQEAGLAGLTVRKLAQRVGFSEAALYRHYPSKESLLVALMERVRGRLMEPIREIARDRSRPPRERLTAILRQHVKLVLEVEGLPILLVAEAAASGNEALLEQMRQQIGEYLDLLESLIEELPPRPGRPTSQELAMLLVGLPAVTAIFYRLGSDPALGTRSQELASFLVERLTGHGELAPHEDP